MPEGWLAKWLDHWSMRQTLLKASPAGTLLFQRSRLSLVVLFPLWDPWNSVHRSGERLSLA